MKIILYFLISLTIILLNTKGIYLIGGGDSELPYYFAKSSIENLSQLWLFQNASGTYFASGLPSLLFYIFCIPLTFLPIKIANYLFYSILLFLIFISVDKLRNTFQKYYLGEKKNEKHIDIMITIVSTGTLMFFILFYRVIFIELIAFALIAYGVERLFIFLNNGIKSRSIFFLSLIPLVLLGQNIGHLIIFILLCITFTLFHCFIYVNKIKTSIQKFFVFGGVLIILSSYWLIPFIHYFSNQYEALSSNSYTQYYTVEIPFQEQNKHSRFYRVLGGETYNFIGPEAGFYPVDKNNILLYLSGIFPLFLSLFFLIKGRNKKIYSFLLLFYLGASILILGNYGPIGEFYKKLVLEVPGMMALRAVDTKVNYFIWIIQILIIQLIFFNISLSKVKRYIYISLFILLIPSLLFAGNIVHREYSLFKTDITYLNEIENITNVLQEKGYTRAITLPFTGYQWPTFDKSGYWGYAFFQFSNPKLSLYNLGTTAYSNFDEKYYQKLEEDFKNGIINISYFNKRGIGYIILQNNFDYKFTKYYTFQNQETSIKRFFATNSDDLKLLYNGEYLSLYKINGNTNPIRKGGVNSDLFISGVSTKKTINSIDSFHPEWKLYLEPYSEIDCKNPNTYSGSLNQKTENYTIQAGDDYQKIVANQSGVTLDILRELNPDIDERELKIGQVLTLKKTAGDSYNVTECESENRFYVGGELSKLWEKPIFDDTHTMIYDYANQWTIDPEYIKANYSKEYYKENPDGSIDVRMTLYFKPQSYFYLGLIISGSTILLLLGYLGYDVVRNRRRRNSKK